jgi:hypothetical protein
MGELVRDPEFSPVLLLFPFHAARGCLSEAASLLNFAP